MTREHGPDKDLINRAFRIKPVVTDQEGALFFVDPIDLYEKIYNFDGGLYPVCRAERHLEKIGDIEVAMPATLWGGEVGGPTIAQVLPQIPDDLLPKAVAFKVGTSDSREGDNGYVYAKCEVYGGELPEKVAKQSVIAWRKTYAEPFPEPAPITPPFNGAAATTLDEDVHVMKPLELKKNPPITPKP